MKDFAPLIERAFDFVPAEESYFVEEVEGRVPAFVRGTYYLNGPARFERAGMRYRHWLDGDGMVCALRFEGGRVRFNSRFVCTAKLAAEEEAGRPLFRTFGTAFERDLLKRRMGLESPVNVSVYRHAGALLAFGEQGLPCELDPLTLETRGEFNFRGALNDVTPFAAHPKFDNVTGEMFNFGVAFSPAAPHLNFYRFDAQGALRARARIPLEHPCTMHDFGLSETYGIFYVSPYLLDMKALVVGGRALMDALEWRPELGSRLLVVSRATGESVASVPVGSRYCLHLVNCFEDGERLTVDLVEFERPIYDQYREVPDLFRDVCEGLPVRLVFDTSCWELVERRELDYRLAPDFPAIDPRRAARPYEDFWMLGISATGRRGRKFFDQLVHARWDDARTLDIYQPPAAHYLGGEPIFVPDSSNARAGAVICQIFDAHSRTTSFAVFDAFDVAAGPAASLRLRAPIHLGFHATFDPHEGA